MVAEHTERSVSATEDDTDWHMNWEELELIAEDLGSLNMLSGAFLSKWNNYAVSGKTH